MTLKRSWRNQTEWEARAKAKGKKWLNGDNPIKSGPRADKRCRECGHWLYAEGTGHDCEESVARGR